MIHRYRRKGAVTFSPLRYLAVATSVLALLIAAVVALLADPGESGASVIASSGNCCSSHRPQCFRRNR